MANEKARFVTFVTCVKHLESQFFAISDILIPFTTRSEAYILRSGDFVRTDDADRRTKPIILPLAHESGVTYYAIHI